MALASKEMTGRNPAEHLTDDIISDPNNRKKLAQTLAGFFYHTYSCDRFPKSARHFTNVTGKLPPLVSPSLSFLPGSNNIKILDSCNGVLLCRRRTAGAVHYVVCNPATKEWVELPESSQGGVCTARLGFDSTVSPHFHVFEFIVDDEDATNGNIFIVGLEIYSSKAGEWVRRDSGWSDDASLCDDMYSVFFNDSLHVFSPIYQDVLVVDTEGKVWRTISVPFSNDDGFIARSQGSLFYLNTMGDHDLKLSVYVLEDYPTDEWVFKHSVRISTLLGGNNFSLMQNYSLITIHPECNRIFFISDLDNTLRCYDMDRRQVHVIHNIGCDRKLWERSLPYEPLFLKALTGQN